MFFNILDNNFGAINSHVFIADFVYMWAWQLQVKHQLLELKGCPCKRPSACFVESLRNGRPSPLVEKQEREKEKLADIMQTVWRESIVPSDIWETYWAMFKRWFLRREVDSDWVPRQHCDSWFILQEDGNGLPPEPKADWGLFTLLFCSTCIQPPSMSQ